MRPVIKVAPVHGDAPATVGPWPCVVRFVAANMAKAGAKTHNVCDA